MRRRGPRRGAGRGRRGLRGRAGHAPDRGGGASYRRGGAAGGTSGAATRAGACPSAGATHDAIPHLRAGDRAVRRRTAPRPRRWLLLSTAYLRAGRLPDVARAVALRARGPPSTAIGSRLLTNESGRLMFSSELEAGRAAAERALERGGSRRRRRSDRGRGAVPGLLTARARTTRRRRPRRDAVGRGLRARRCGDGIDSRARRARTPRSRMRASGSASRAALRRSTGDGATPRLEARDRGGPQQSVGRLFGIGTVGEDAQGQRRSGAARGRGPPSARRPRSRPPISRTPTGSPDARVRRVARRASRSGWRASTRRGSRRPRGAPSRRRCGSRGVIAARPRRPARARAGDGPRLRSETDWCRIEYGRVLCSTRRWKDRG